MRERNTEDGERGGGGGGGEGQREREEETNFHIPYSHRRWSP